MNTMGLRLGRPLRMKWSTLTLVTGTAPVHGTFGGAPGLGWRHEPPLPPPGHPRRAGRAHPDRGPHRRAEGLAMAEPLLRALARMRGLILDDQVLVRAVAAGRQKG